ncbi:mucin-17-like [Galleria mellonella]|uniref:Mucin-17-like n=1 Tax=Galleria mellonella TaxID=7137 RepID=A0A6J1W9T4_GALME|nr:mucin-17-like [Galleria mellonella]
MSEQTENCYLDGDVVWVKLGSCWWPGEVVGFEKLPPDVLPSFRKPPIAVVKFFQEDTYEYVKNTNLIYKYNCSRKNEFISKGLYMYRTKHGHMEKFPEDVIRAETAIGGDIEILTREEFQETKKESYAGLFGDPKKTPGSGKKGRGKGRPAESPKLFTPTRKIKEKTDYKVHILVQGSNTPSQPTEVSSIPSTSCNESDTANEKPQNLETPQVLAPLIPTCSSSGIYSCHACSFSTTRLNVLILHNKTHSVTFTPYTPSPVRKKPIKSSPKSTPNTSKISKVRRPHKEKLEGTVKKPTKSLKRTSEDGKDNSSQIKKLKTDEEIKSSLLADWDDIDDEESNDESSTMVLAGSPETAVAAESPAIPTPAELPNIRVAGDTSPPTHKQFDDLSTNEKAESSSDSKYEFCEDEDWPLETDAGRKIPRVKNASKRKDDAKSVSLDDDEMAKEVAELLNKTTVPELPSVPESLKVEENFPEPSIVKSPDKKLENLPDSSKNSIKFTTENQPTKAIFKTKTFFRSRHSRSQDAIGKYIAEQLNAVERMDMSENEINGSDAVSSPEARDSSPVEHVKVARLAPKIQLKKMKAEAAQLREKERNNKDQVTDDASIPISSVASKLEDTFVTNFNTSKQTENGNKTSPSYYPEDVLYPTQDIKLVDEEIMAGEKNIQNSEENNKENLHDGRPENTITANNNVTKECITSPEMNKVETTFSVENLPETKKSCDQDKEPFMNESTASAVDALLSVSRDADRVTRIISNDPPEDLFEDDKDNGTNNNINGVNDNVNQIDSVNKDLELNLENEQEAPFLDVKNNINEHKNINNDKNEHSDRNSLDNQSISMDSIELPVETEIKNNHTSENVPSESDLQIAEALINLPSTAIQSKSNDHQEVFLPTEIKQTEENALEIPDNVVLEDQVYNETEDKKPPDSRLSPESILAKSDNINVRFETEQEKSENLNAAQSLVQMSESVDHKINIIETNNVNNKDSSDVSSYNLKKKNGIDNISTVEQKVALLSSDSGSESIIVKPSVSKFETTSSKLLKMLEEPGPPKLSLTKATPTKQIVIPSKEKILNFDVAKSSLSSKSSPVIIRRTPSNKTLLNNLNDLTSDKIIFSRSNKHVQEAPSVQTYTIQTAPETTTETNTITIIQQKPRKVSKTPTKLQKIKPSQSQNSLVTPLNDNKPLNTTSTADEAMFDINSMPIVLSDDLLTPESIEKMPIVMSDGNIISNTPNPPKLIKTKSATVENEKNAVNPGHKPEVKTLLMNPVTDVNKITPNILSKSSKIRGGKPMLVIDKATGKQKIIVTKTEPMVKEVKQTPTLIQPAPQTTGKTEKFIILPTASSPRPGGRPQKIVIDPQTGKAHVLVAKGPETSISMTENKPVSAKLVPSSSDGSTPGSTVMIITNAQGATSRIVLTPEHERILFPNKQQANVSQLKTITHRISPNPNSGNIQKTMVTGVAPVKTQTRIVPKQKNAIITSKGQLIVGGRVATATATQNIAPMPEIRPSPKRIVAAAEPPKKIIQTIQKPSSEPLIFLQQKSGTVVQLTASQFEHFQRTGQIIQKVPAPIHENKIIVQKTKTVVAANETIVSKQRVRKTAIESSTPVKKVKQEIAIAPAPAQTLMPALTPISSTPITSLLQPNIVSNTVSVTTTPSYPELENFEELLPSTAIARQSEVEALQADPPAPVPSVAPAPAPVPAPAPTPAPPAPLSDGQLLAVPGEHFGGPQGSFYLCVEDNGTLTPIDNRPLVLENNQLVPMAVEPLPILAPQPERRDILEAALANSDVFHADTPRDEAPDFRDLNANVSVHCRVSETSTTLNQPIMTPVEVPTKGDSEPTVPSNLEDGLAVIGVTPHTVPTSLELPITVTDPRIAPKTTDPLSGTNYGTTLLPSPNTEMTFVTTEEVDMPAVGPISMPLLTDEESVGKSMPILTDEVAERTVSSVESTIGSPSSIDVRESETEDGSQWTQRLLTPGSDTSETSAEIPLQPVIQLSANDLSRHS